MKNKRSFYWLMSLMLMLTLFLAACNSESGNTAEDEGGDDATDTEQGSEGDSEESSGEPQEGGTITFAVDSEPEGILNIHHYGTATDADIMQFMVDPLFEYDENLAIEPNLAEWETEDNKVYTFTFKEGIKWHNGDELTVNDWKFALETLAHPDYQGPRYSNVQTIEGAPAYHDGEADSISGIEVIDDYTIKVTFDKARTNNLLNVWSYPMNENYWKDVPVADMIDHKQSRQEPIGTGPFKLNKVVPGESYEYVAFEDYWQGAPKLDKIIVKVIDNKAVTGALENGDVDVVPVHPTLGEQVEEMENVELVTSPGLSYYYVGFKFGKFDNDKKEIVEPNEKYANLELRKAMYHAIDRDSWINAFFSGYGSKVNAPVPTSHWIAADQSELNDYAYDPEKAKSILDEAGYKDVDGDGFREDPNGDQFVVNFAHYSSTNPTFEARAKALTQYWEDIGLKSELQMMESSLYYDKLEKDAGGLEVFFGGWSTGSDPDPSALWKSDQLWNLTRWENEKSDELLDKALDIEVVGTDKEKQKEIYEEWQVLLNEQLPMLYIAELEETNGVNKRVGGLEIDVSGLNSSHLWYVEQ